MRQYRLMSVAKGSSEPKWQEEMVVVDFVVAIVEVVVTEAAVKRRS